MSSNCDVNQHPTCVPALDPKQDPPPTGIFDFASPDNLFADDSVLFVPYCTGDVHLGNKTVAYSTPAFESTQVNGARLSDWVAGLAVGRVVNNVSLTSGT
jgi:hypothetical protein